MWLSIIALLLAASSLLVSIIAAWLGSDSSDRSRRIEIQTRFQEFYTLLLSLDRSREAYNLIYSGIVPSDDIDYELKITTIFYLEIIQSVYIDFVLRKTQAHVSSDDIVRRVVDRFSGIAEIQEIVREEGFDRRFKEYFLDGTSTRV